MRPIQDLFECTPIFVQYQGSRSWLHNKEEWQSSAHISRRLGLSPGAVGWTQISCASVLFFLPQTAIEYMREELTKEQRLKRLLQKLNHFSGPSSRPLPSHDLSVLSFTFNRFYFDSNFEYWSRSVANKVHVQERSRTFVLPCWQKVEIFAVHHHQRKKFYPLPPSPEFPFLCTLCAFFCSNTRNTALIYLFLGLSVSELRRIYHAD